MQNKNSSKVGYVLKRYPRYSETFVVNEILAHERSGMEIEIFALRPPCDQYFQNLISKVRSPVNYLPYSGIKTNEFWKAIKDVSVTEPALLNLLHLAIDEDVRDVYQAVFLAGEVRQKRINHLHAHFATSATNVARMASAFSGITYSFTAHAKDIFHDAVNSDQLRRKLSDSTNTITVSDFNLSYLRDQFGADAARVHRVYNGLDLDLFPFQEPETRPSTIMSVGRLVEKKGFGVLVDACSILKEDGVPFTCEIIGTGDLESNLRKKIDDFSLQDRVKLPGPRPQSELVELIQNAAVFAAPCIIGEDGNRDGLPTVLLEAMALGTPCVSTNVTGIPEIIKDGETGLLSSQQDPESLAVALRRLLEDIDLRKRLAHQARQLIETEFNIHKNAGKIRSLITDPSSSTMKKAPQEEVCA